MSLNAIHIAAVFVEDDAGRLVLQLRDDKPDIRHPNHWGLWGGRVEEGESPPEAAVREVFEELTLNVPEGALRFFTSVSLDAPAREWHVFFWHAGAAVDAAIVNEGQGLGRFFLEELATDTLEGRPVHPIMMQLHDAYRTWRARIRIV